MILGGSSVKRLTSNEKKVLTYLMGNSKISDSNMAKNMSISSQAIRKLRNRLETLGIIKKYCTTLNYNSIGLNIFSLLLIKVTAKGMDLIKNLNGENIVVNLIPNLIDVYRTQNSEITHIVLCAFKDLTEYNEYVSVFQSKFYNIIEIKKAYIFSNLNILKESPEDTINKVIYEGSQKLIPEPWTIGEILSAKSKIYPKKIKNRAVSLSQNEKFILKSLIKNSRVKDITIAKKRGISKNAVGKIRKKLENVGVINNYSLNVDYKELGIGAFVIAFIENTSKSWRILRKSGLLKSTYHPNIIKVYDILSQMQIIVFGFRDLSEVDNYFHKFKQKMGEYFIVKDIFIFSSDSVLKNSPDQLFSNLIGGESINRKSKVELSIYFTLLKNIALKANGNDNLIKATVI